MLDHRLRCRRESGRGVLTQPAMFVHQRHRAVPGVEAACAQHQRMRRRINDGQIDQGRYVMPRALQDIGADDRHIAERPVVVVLVSDLIVGNQRHQVDAIEPLHTLEAGKAAPALQIVVGDHDDLRDELT